MNKFLRALLKSIRTLWFASYDFLEVSIFRKYPIKYFDSVLNVGDQINPYLVGVILGQETFNVRSGRLKHVVGLGSMFHVANKNSIIWGTGIISEESAFRFKTKCLSVKAVRGRLTENILVENGVVGRNDVVLGDPGLLMPLFYKPSIEKVSTVGVVPHYVDADLPFFKENDDIAVIHVRKGPESFIDQLLSCDFIVSSSLHGLILADAYGIPNKWVSFSDKITGGTFKYHDYYSTTDKPDEGCFFVDGEECFSELIGNIEKHVSVKNYIFNKELLINSFPRL